MLLTGHRLLTAVQPVARELFNKLLGESLACPPGKIARAAHVKLQSNPGAVQGVCTQAPVSGTW